MSLRLTIPHKTDVLVRYVAPTNVGVEPNEPLSNADDGSTASFKVMDPSKSEVLSADEASGQTTLSVTGAAAFEDGDLVDVELDDGSVHETFVTTTDPVAGTIDVNDAIPSAASEGRRVRVRLGSEIAMSDFGTPKLGRRDWGFQGTLPGDHPGLEVGKEVDVEISFVGAVGGGLDALEVICAVVRPVDDCES